MANQSSARIKGDDYQHLISWHHILSLKLPGTQVTTVGVEDPFAGSVDDVTVYRKNGAAGSADFYQIKYHVDQRSLYTIELMLDQTNGTSLLKKFWDTWQKLKSAMPTAGIRLHLVSTWGYSPDDKILSIVSTEDNQLPPEFYIAGKQTAIGKAKEIIRTALNTTEAELHDFFKVLFFDLGKDCSKEFKERVAERMDYLNLRREEKDLLVAVGIVRDWVKKQDPAIDLNKLEQALKENNLYKAAQVPKSVSVYLITVKEHKFDVQPDYELDWRNYFEKESNIYGHELKDETGWNNLLLPQLHQLEQRINRETGAHVIRARGFARLSAWFAFGFTFSEVSGYKIEINQQDKLWRSDEQPSADFEVISENGDGDRLDENSDTVAVGISVTGSLEQDVNRHISAVKNVKALLLLRPKKDLGKECLVSASDTTAFVQLVKQRVREFVSRNNAKRLSVYYFGPLSGACFLGNQFNAVCREIQIFENIPGGGYVSSFTLK